jgi:hypothetical protein
VRLGFFVGVAVALGLAASGASSAISKVTLTVVVHGNGTVVSRPAGISCPGTCKLRVRADTRVALTATPDSGSTLARWANGCAGTSSKCTVTMKRSRAVSVSFNTPPPPPPPPPPAKPGHYKGTYSDGTFIQFDVGSAGLSLGNIGYDLNGECSDGSTSYGDGDAPGPFAIQPDGSFQGTYPYTVSNATGTVNISGKFSSDGSASGTLSDTFTFTSGDAQGISCSTKGTWTAHVQP